MSTVKFAHAATSVADKAVFNEGLVLLNSGNERLWFVDDSSSIWIKAVITNEKQKGGAAKAYFLSPKTKTDQAQYGFLLTTVIGSDYDRVQASGATGVTEVMVCLGKRQPLPIDESKVMASYGPDAPKPNARAVSNWKKAMESHKVNPKSFHPVVLAFLEPEE